MDNFDVVWWSCHTLKLSEKIFYVSFACRRLAFNSNLEGFDTVRKLFLSEIKLAYIKVVLPLVGVFLFVSGYYTFQ